MQLTIDRDGRNPIYWQIADQIKKGILEGTIADGAALPSERSLAENLGVHRNTVIRAYARLRDEEYIDSSQGVGYVVTYGESREAAGGVEREIPKDVNWSNLIKEEYQDTENTFDDIFRRFTEERSISFSTGMPPDIYDQKDLGAEIAYILKEEGRKHFYLSPYQGDPALRRRILSFLRNKGIRAELSQIQVMSETNQALDFITGAILKQGDTVITEEPVSPDVYRIINLAGGKIVTVPVDEDGMICDNLAGLIEKTRPAFIYVNSSFQDPAGVVLSVERKKKLLELSYRYRVPIVEEDAASELAFGDRIIPSIKSMDRGNNVIYIYSFALTFIPGMAMSFVTGPDRLIKCLSHLVSVKIMYLDWITQKLLAKHLAEGKYYDNVSRIKKMNREKCELMCSYLDKLSVYGVRYRKPEGGIYIWAELPEGADGKKIAARCLRKGVTITPGEVFFPYKNGGRNFARLNYSYENEERIHEGMKVFSQVIMDFARENTD